MNILFLTTGRIIDLSERTIYCDLLRQFLEKGHSVYTLSPGNTEPIRCTVYGNNAVVAFANVDTARGSNNLIKKGLSTLVTGKRYIQAIKKYYGSLHFDLVLYTTPPISFCSAVDYVKRRDGSKSYLLLKDIFPQNAVDIGMIPKSGVKGFLYIYFRNQEKKLYRISDHIGCMSKANVDYIIRHNPEVAPQKVEVCPNSVEVMDLSVDTETKREIRKKYGIPLDKKVLVYGGNLGKPQGIPFLIECINKSESVKDAYFLIVGDGTEYHLVSEYVDRNKPKNMKLMRKLPKEDYDRMVGACDIGLIFLDYRFTIPNFPSRLLAYMQAKLPVLAATDPNTDIGRVIENGGFGWWCESNDSAKFVKLVGCAVAADTTELGRTSYHYLQENYSTENSYDIILRNLQNDKCSGERGGV